MLSALFPSRDCCWTPTILTAFSIIVPAEFLYAMAACLPIASCSVPGMMYRLGKLISSRLSGFTVVPAIISRFKPSIYWAATASYLSLPVVMYSSWILYWGLTCVTPSMLLILSISFFPKRARLKVPVFFPGSYFLTSLLVGLAWVCLAWTVKVFLTPKLPSWVFTYALMPLPTPLVKDRVRAPINTAAMVKNVRSLERNKFRCEIFRISAILIPQ